MFRAAEAKLTSTLKISEECYISSASNEKLDANWTFQERGLHLMSEGKLAVVLVVSESEKQGWGSGLDLVESESDGILPHSLLQKFLCEDQGVEEVILISRFHLYSSFLPNVANVKRSIF